MSEVSWHESQEILVPPFNAHVFRCPYCKDYTTLLSTRTFICHEETECENCGREFVVENDCARALEYADVSHQ